ncbi:stage II sporulation protein P [Haloimpatiens sp. FM7315]|uniref:stage II sporulation protein P n=1 Tax=Haloimpatiens sp. FM7315 TaxID=3298609 RepID=UPI00370C3E4A
MDYKKIMRKIDLMFNKKFKYIMCILCMVVFLISSVMTPRWVKAYSAKDEKVKSGFYIRLLNFTLPTLQVINEGPNNCDYKEKGIFSKSSIKEEFSKFVLNKEISIIENNEKGDNNQKDSSEKEDTKDKDIYNNDAEVVVNPFELKDDEIIENDMSKENTISKVYDPKLKKKLDINKPEILIYHTHTCESYKPGKASCTDQSVNVCAAGEVLANELMNNYGISVIHDKTVHPYLTCYKESGKTVDKYLKKYGKFKLIIDLHRDSISDRKSVVTKVNGEEVARYMFVLERNNSNYKSNLKLANELVKISDKLYPNLIRKRKIYEYGGGVGHFNQNKSPNSALIELGSYVNTTEEAKKTAKCIARIIAENINKK